MAIDLTSNIISWWKLNETSGTAVSDNSGDNNGTLVSESIANTTSINAPDGRTRSFFINDAHGRNVNLDDVADFSFGDGSVDSPFSFALWANMGSSSGDGIFISKYNTSTNIEYVLRKSGTYTFIQLFDGTTGSANASFQIPSYQDDSWHFLVATYDGRGGSDAHLGLRFYVDGIESDSYRPSMSGTYSSMNNTSAKLYLGGRESGGLNLDGYLSDVMIFDKSLTDGEVRYLYNDGFGVTSLIDSIADSISAPTLIYPNGGEIFTEGDINIQWKEPGSLLSTELIWYEIFITDDFDKNKKEELIQIAAIPSGNTSYSYTIEKNLRGERCRVGIRSVNNRGFRSNMSFSADNFTIINEGLPSPVLLEPIKGNTYFSYVPFIFDHNGVLGRSSQRSFYQIYYKSDKKEIDWTLLQSNIMVGSDPINIDVSDFDTNSDYVFKIELVDGGNTSAPVFIEEININNINLFLIDTIAPIGTIKIIDNEEYTKDTSLILQISASDETSAVKDVQIQQTNMVSGETNDIDKSPFVPLTPLLTWDIKPEGSSTEVLDGVKLIQARFRDYGNNQLQIFSEKYFRTYKNLDNREVTSFFYGSIGANSNLYSTFASVSSTGSQAELYRDFTFLSALAGDATSIEIYNNVLYIAIKDDENKGILQRYTGGSVNTIADNTQEFLDVSETVVNSLYASDSVINAMEVFDNTLFLGLDNGTLLSFKGSSVSLENNDYLNIRSIRNIRTDGIMLYIFFNNTTEILIMNKNVAGSYIFSTVDTES